VGEPLKGSTINRYLSTLGTVYKHAKRLRVVSRAHVSPTRGLERAPEPVDPERYLRPDEVARLITMARVVDRRWTRLPALITLAFHTGLRIGNLTALRWCDVDLRSRTASVTRTKNGQPIVAALTAACVLELEKLPDKHPDALVFAVPPVAGYLLDQFGTAQASLLLAAALQLMVPISLGIFLLLRKRMDAPKRQATS